MTLNMVKKLFKMQDLQNHWSTKKKHLMRSIKVIKSWGKIYEAKPSNIILMLANVVGFSIQMKKWILLRNNHHSLAFPRGKLKKGNIRHAQNMQNTTCMPSYHFLMKKLTFL